jgi:phage/plasmid-like protein (TIGR03299 family)
MYGSNVAAWHKLGIVVDGQPTSAEAMRLAHLDWAVHLEALWVGKTSLFTTPIDDSFGVVRDDIPDTRDSRRYLGVVGSRYHPIQNVDAFGFADALVGEGGARFESAGSLRNGRIVWLLAALPQALRVKDDTINQYLLLKTTHDGTGALQAMLTPVRVVCWNTLSAALRGAKNTVNIRHTAKALQKVAEARRVLGLAQGYFNGLGEQLEKMAEKPINADEVWAFVNALVPNPKPTEKAHAAGQSRAAATRSEIVQLYAGGQQGAKQKATRGTVYGLYNAAAEYADHGRTVRKSGGGSQDEARMESSLWGSAAAFKEKAFELASKLADPAETIISNLNLGD